MIQFWWSKCDENWSELVENGLDWTPKKFAQYLVFQIQFLVWRFFIVDFCSKIGRNWLKNWFAYQIFIGASWFGLVQLPKSAESKIFFLFKEIWLNWSCKFDSVTKTDWNFEKFGQKSVWIQKKMEPNLAKLKLQFSIFVFRHQKLPKKSLENGEIGFNPPISNFTIRNWSNRPNHPTFQFSKNWIWDYQFNGSKIGSNWSKLQFNRWKIGLNFRQHGSQFSQFVQLKLKHFQRTTS